MASTPIVPPASPEGAVSRRETHGAGSGFLVAALLPACIVAELAAPARDTRAGFLSAALDRARAAAAQAFSLPG